MNHTCTKVTVRQRAIRNDRISLYLDYYPAVRNPETMQMSRREYLGIYLYAHPRNEMERAFNNEMLNKAEAIRCIRVQSLINEEFGFLDKTKQKADFLAYFKKMCRTKDEKWTFVYQHFYNFVKGKCSFGEINMDLVVALGGIPGAFFLPPLAPLPLFPYLRLTQSKTHLYEKENFVYNMHSGDMLSL